MKILIFGKKYLKSSLFLFVLLSIACIYFLNKSFIINNVNSLEMGLFDRSSNEISQILVDNLVSKNNEFKYIVYEDVEKMKSDVRKQNISYGFVIDFDNDKIFTQYSNKDMFANIIKEDFYSSYYEILGQDYTKKLLKIEDEDYNKKYENQLKYTFNFDYCGNEKGSMFPLTKICVLMIYISSLMVCYDYMKINSKSDFFKVFKSEKLKLLFICTCIFINAILYYLVISISVDFNILSYILYNILIFEQSIVIIKLFNKNVYKFFMPFFIIFSIISMLVKGINSKLSNISLIFLNNSYGLLNKTLVLIVGYFSVLIAIYYLQYRQIKYIKKLKYKK